MIERKEPIPPDVLKTNLAAIRARMAEAAVKSSRAPDAVKLVAVTKYVGLEEIRALQELGVSDFGESRIQDAEKKIKALSGAAPLRWHLIGHLQTNKADKAVKLFQTVHSVDSLRVAQALDKEARKQPGREPLPCLLEVNVAGEANKFGLPPQYSPLSELLQQCAALSGIRITGLMSMAPYAGNPEATSRPVFRTLRALFEELNAKNACPHPLTELSMGMTQDYTIAIEEGATIVRVGSALFE